MSEELKPCPFCGGTKIDETGDGQSEWFECVNCGATSGNCPDEQHINIDLWNTRPALDGNKELVEAFSELTTSILDNVTLEYMDEMTEGRMTKAIDAILAIKD